METLGAGDMGQALIWVLVPLLPLTSRASLGKGFYVFSKGAGPLDTLSSHTCEYGDEVRGYLRLPLSSKF